MRFDLRTLQFLFFYTNLIGTGAMAFVFTNVRKSIKGSGLWLTGMLIQTLGMFLMFFPEGESLFFLHVSGILLILAGNAIFTEGYVRFVDRHFITIQNYLILPLAAIGLWYFSAVQNDLLARDMIFSVVAGIYALEGGFVFLVDTKSRKSQSARITGWVLLLFFALCVGRLFSSLFMPIEPGDPAWIDTLLILNQLVYFGLSVCLVLSTILMVNQRLFSEAKEQELKFTTAFHSSPYAILLTRISDGTIIEVNEGFVAISGYSTAELLGQSTLSVNFWCSQKDCDMIVKKALSGNPVRNIELDIRAKDGHVVSGLFSSDIITLAEEQCLLSTFSDTTELSRVKSELERRATHDSLTGLPNRDLLQSHFKVTKAFADRYHKSFAVLSIDIDHFKSINDTFGHDVGDEVLVLASQILCRTLRKGDVVTRFGGDEFIVLLCEITDRNAAETVAMKMTEAFHEPLLIAGEHRTVTLSIGIAMYPDDGTVLQELLKNADLAMYGAKANGRDGYCFYRASAPSANAENDQ